LESRCSSSSNLAVLIAVPIVSIIVLIGIIGGLLYWRMKRSKKEEENLFPNSGVRFSSNNQFSSDRDELTIRTNQYERDYNILSERL
jgi:hypothetical protein